MNGGECGERGLNWLIRIIEDEKTQEKIEHIISLGGKNTVICFPNDRIRIMTPGGGGYGHYDELINNNNINTNTNAVTIFRTTGSVNQYTMDQETA